MLLVVRLKIVNKLTDLPEHINKHEGVEWVTFEEMSDDFKKRNTPPEGALMPATQKEAMEKYYKKASK